MATTVADQLIDVLLAAGVRRVYGVVGDSLNPVVDGMAEALNGIVQNLNQTLAKVRGVTEGVTLAIERISRTSELVQHGAPTTAASVGRCRVLRQTRHRLSLENPACERGSVEEPLVTLPPFAVGVHERRAVQVGGEPAILVLDHAHRRALGGDSPVAQHKNTVGM